MHDFILDVICRIQIHIWALIFVCWNRFNLKKLTYEERKNKLIERLNAFNSAAHADDDDDEWWEIKCLLAHLP